MSNKSALVWNCASYFYYMSLPYIMVSYAIAIKRAGNILLANLFGKIFYKEKISK